MNPTLKENLTDVRDRMYCAQLMCDAYLFCEYTNLMDKTLEVIAAEDPQHIHRDGGVVSIGESLISAWLNIQVVSLELGDDPIEDTPIDPGEELDTHTWTVDNVMLDMKDFMGELISGNFRAKVIKRDYLDLDTIEIEPPDTADFKYARTYVVIFYASVGG